MLSTAYDVKGITPSDVASKQENAIAEENPLAYRRRLTFAVKAPGRVLTHTVGARINSLRV